jgi:dolichol-phosphate mannosyltransferase
MYRPVRLGFGWLEPFEPLKKAYPLADNPTEIMKRLISIVTPCYNEAENVDELHRRLSDVFELLGERYDFEVIAVENGSADSTYDRLIAIRERDRRWKILRLSRNWGMDGAMSAGLVHARGDAAVLMASDLQDPPEVIPRFVEKWEEGFQNVYGVITRRPDESRFRRTAAHAFYKIINRLSETPVPRNASDFRLVDRKAYTAFNKLSERNRMMRAMWGFIGFRSCGVEHERAPRHKGTSKYRVLPIFDFAFRAILSYSYMPLKVIPFFGIASAALSFTLMAGFAIRAFFYGVPFDGFGTITSLMLMLFGVLFLFLGIVSEYVGMIYTETRGRPTYIVSSQAGLGNEADPVVVPIELQRLKLSS